MKLLSLRKVILMPGGGRYMTRWYLLRRGCLGAYLHQWFAGDSDPRLHSHPWGFVTIVLRGGYVEETADRWGNRHVAFHDAGSIIHRPVTHWHRVVSVKPGTWTLFFRGPRRKAWGFLNDDGSIEVANG